MAKCEVEVHVTMDSALATLLAIAHLSEPGPTHRGMTSADRLALIHRLAHESVAKKEAVAMAVTAEPAR